MTSMNLALRPSMTVLAGPSALAAALPMKPMAMPKATQAMSPAASTAGTPRINLILDPSPLNSLGRRSASPALRDGH
jgi:hypothetical protein